MLAPKVVEDNPFKNLTTVNVVQNVVNYNIGNSQSSNKSKTNGNQSFTAGACSFLGESSGSNSEEPAFKIETPIIVALPSALVKKTPVIVAAI